MPSLAFDHVLTPTGWLSPARIDIDAAGTITAVGAHDRGPCETGFAIPALPNLHSHAFQRAIAGHSEARCEDAPEDSFWTWRRAMYDTAQRLEPDDVSAIAAGLYAEMLCAGMTAVGEFHYLHKRRDGRAYSDATAMSRAIERAARATGIGLTLLPVLYMQGGFGAPIEPHQRRFAHASAGEFLDLVARLRADSATPVGMALHSLRAVPPDALEAAVAGFTSMAPAAPIHIHVAEQRREVEDCERVLGARPVAWLLENAPVDARWCLVHATHLDPHERVGLAASGAVAGLCPTTEANLGDGLFPLADYVGAGGAFGIGSDSQICVGAAEELRTLEYGQRLAAERRIITAGTQLWESAARGGAQALAQATGAIAAGHRADIVVLDAGDPRLVGHGTTSVLDAFVFSTGPTNPIRDVYVAGEKLVSDRVHVRDSRIRPEFEAALRRLELQ